MGPREYHGYVKGSPGLAEYTGIKDHRVHQRWREMGLPYTMIGKIYIYKKRDVERFLDKAYGVTTIKVPGRVPRSQEAAGEHGGAGTKHD